MAKSLQRMLSIFQKSKPESLIVQQLDELIGSKPRLFGTPLELLECDIVSGQRVPAILTFICRKIIENHGCSEEAIFRISVCRNTLQNIREQLEHCNALNKPLYLDGSQNPLVLASLLKEWLRCLPEPLITPKAYACIGADPESFLTLLSEVNRNTLLFLVHFLRLIASPANMPKTKMTLKALATIFAPNIFRSEEILLKSIPNFEDDKLSYYPLKRVTADGEFIYGDEPIRESGQLMLWVMANVEREANSLLRLMRTRQDFD